jgi:hypothetical protein
MLHLVKDPLSGLMLPRQHVDEKISLKKVIDKIVDEAVYAHQYLKDVYYLTIHAKFDKYDPTQFTVSPPVITSRLPPFTSNQMVFWVNNANGICELLWMVTRSVNKKLNVEFNKKGVAYLQAKGAMPT